jgi:hypothetical protein
MGKRFDVPSIDFQVFGREPGAYRLGVLPPRGTDTAGALGIEESILAKVRMGGEIRGLGVPLLEIVPLWTVSTGNKAGANTWMEAFWEPR